MGCLLQKTLKQLFPDRPIELLMAVAVYNEIPHSKVGKALCFPPSAVPMFESALRDYDRRLDRLRSATPVAIGA